MNKFNSCVLFFLLFYLVGCTDDTALNPSNSNTPVVSKTSNAFSYTLASDFFTSIAEYDLLFTSDSLAFSLIVSRYFSGSGMLTIKDSSGANIYSESLQGNKVISFTQTGVGIPKKAQLEFDRYTGTVVFALARSNSN